MTTNTAAVLVDVREDIRNGRNPFSKIMNAASRLRAGEQLRLIAPFEPVPLVHVLTRQGFQHRAQSNATGDWEVLFERQPTAQPVETSSTGEPEQPRRPAKALSNQKIEIDARGLEPPLPMIKILESLGTLPMEAALCARTDRRPIHLYAQLEERGFAAQTEEQSDGSFLTLITRQ